jgi:Flp pilus assembly protein TadD
MSRLNALLLRWGVVPMATCLLAALVTRQFLGATGGAKEARFQRTMSEAVQAYQGGNRPRALQRLQAAAQLAPKTADIHMELAGGFQALGQRHNAAQHFEQALRLTPAMGEPAGFAQLVQTYLDGGDAPEADRLLRNDLLRRWPEAAETLYAQGLLTLYRAKTTQDIEQAGQCFERSLRLKPGSQPARAQLGIVCWRLGQLTKAESLLREVLAKEPKNTVALFHLGQVLRVQGKLEESQKILLEHKRIDDLIERQRHLQLRYSLGQYEAVELLELGRIYAQLGELGRAASTLRVYTRLKPADPQGHEALARIVERLEDKESAKVEHELAQALAKPHEHP